MINSDPASDEVNRQQDTEASGILRSGPRGAVVLAGLATAIVIAIWFAFYLLVFVPRAIAP